MKSDKLKEDLLFYAVTDRTWLEKRTLEEVVSEALNAGVTMLQLREKELDQASFINEAKQLKKLTEQKKVPLIINDDVEVALACDADGIHVGQKDMEAGEVRKKVGPDKIIGVSAQTVEQALLAQKQGADYLGVGAVFSTSTKLDASEVCYETLKEICEAVKIPVVAIGGISEKNLSQLKGSGIAGVAVVSAIFASKNIPQATKTLLELTTKAVKK